MPLEQGESREAMSHNIKEMVEHGHPQNQAVAAAYREAGKDAESPVAEAERVLNGAEDCAPMSVSEAERVSQGQARDANFKNASAYHKWLAYGHMHGVMHGGHEPVSIGGSAHHVNHGHDSGPVSGMDAIMGIGRK